MIKRIFVFVIFAFIFIGCGGIQPSVYQQKAEESKLVYFPDLNRINTIEVGENMFSKSYLVYPNTYEVELLNNVQDRNDYVGYGAYKKGTKGTLQKWGWEGKRLNTLCVGILSCLTDTKNNKYFDSFILRNKTLIKLEKPVKYKIKSSSPFMIDESFKYVVLYQGKNEKKIRLSFREFKDNLARPAFTQNIDYTLEKGKPTIIGFKGLRIEVLKATNIDITYKVLKDFK